MALPTLQRKLFENDGYGPNIKDERLSTDITVKDWDASYDYSANVLAKAGGEIYRSVAASGPGTGAGAVNPTQDVDADYWEVLGKDGSVPVGTVIWLSTTTVPAGYLLCNGAAISRTTYADLFAVIGTTYGTGDGSTTFNLPNLIDRFAQGSATPGTVKAAGLPNITGWFRPRPKDGTDLSGSIVSAGGSFNLTLKSAGSSTSQPITVSGSKISNDQATFDASRSSAIYGNSTTVQPPALTLLTCIKY